MVAVEYQRRLVSDWEIRRVCIGAGSFRCGSVLSYDAQLLQEFWYYFLKTGQDLTGKGIDQSIRWYDRAPESHTGSPYQ